jgi:hypothetical protein
MMETLITPADVTRSALFASGWYDAYWCKDQPATKRGLLNRVAHHLWDGCEDTPAGVQPREAG